MSFHGLLRKVNRSILSDQSIQEPYIFVFPVYKEQKIIDDTLKYYEQFLDKTKSIQLLFVSTAKEQGHASTAQLIRQYQSQSKWKERIVLIQCPELHGTKATQLNFALQYIRHTYSVLPRIVCFDCDARMAYPDFVSAESYITQNSSYLLFSFVPKPIITDKSLSVRSLMLNHFERIVAFEWSSGNFAHYPMGATLIVLPELWQKVEQFPEPIDDIPLAYLLKWKGIKFTSLPYFTQVQAPPDLKNAFHQIIPILKGVFSYFSLAKKYNYQLTLWQSLAGVLSYGFFLLEYLSIITFTYLFIRQGSWFLGLFFIQIWLDLYWSKAFSFQNIILHFWGYYLRLLLFFYFLWKKIFPSQSLSQYKTKRL